MTILLDTDIIARWLVIQGTEGLSYDKNDLLFNFKYPEYYPDISVIAEYSFLNGIKAGISKLFYPGGKVNEIRTH